MNDERDFQLEPPDEPAEADLIPGDDPEGEPTAGDVPWPADAPAVPLAAPLAAPAIPLGVPAADEASASARGRARARQAQRRAKQGHEPSLVGSAPGPRSRPQRQIRPLPRIALPKVNLPFNPAFLGLAGAVVFIVVIVLGLGRLRNDPAEASGNAVWLGREWTLEARTPEEIAELAARLREAQVGTVYAWVSWLQPDATWNGVASFNALPTFSAAFKAAYPEARLLGWLSLPTEAEPGVSRFVDFALQTQVATLSQQIVNEYGFDGVFLSADPIWDGDQNYLALLRTVRAAVGLDVLVGVALPPDWNPAEGDVPRPPLIAPGTEWSTPYKQSVALLADQIVVMAFQSGMGSLDDFQAWVAYQTQVYAEAVAALNIAVEVLIAMPTVGAGSTPRLDPNVENVETSAAGIRAGVQAAGDAGAIVVGAAVYAEWETDAAEWERFSRAWLNTR